MRPASCPLGKVSAFSLLFWACVAVAQPPSFEGLSDLEGGAFYSVGTAVSADGRVVVGISRSGDRPEGEAFRWVADSGMVALGGFTPGQLSAAWAVSSDGRIVAGQSVAADGIQEAFRWTSSTGVQPLGRLAGCTSLANDISGDGEVVVGIACIPDGVEAWRWTAAEGMVGIGGLPGGTLESDATAISTDGLTVVGYDRVDTNLRIAFEWTEGAGMAALGDIPGGIEQSEAHGVSADGSVVVGLGHSATGRVASRWTAGSGMIEIGDLPGGPEMAAASAVSDDGQVVVGWGTTAAGREAFIWTEAEGMRNLREVLVAAGLVLDGWTLYEASDISADGRVVVGYGFSPNSGSLFEAWRAVLPPPATVFEPALDSLLISGDTVTVRFFLPGADRVNLAYSLARPFDPDTSSFTLIAGDVLNEGHYRWTVPAVASTSVHIRVENAALPDSAAFSARFRIRPLHAARVLADSTYELFQANAHGWFFDNSQTQHFPPEWIALPQFQYAGGLDPYTGQAYDPMFAGFPNYVRPTAFAGWPAWVRAFGESSSYVGPGVYNPAYVRGWTAFSIDPFRGACYGMTLMAQMAFADPAAFGIVFPTIGPVTQIYGITDILNARPDIREAVAARYLYQTTNAGAARMNVASSLTPRQTLQEVSDMLRRDDRRDDATLVLIDGGGRGAHAVVPYAVVDLGSHTYTIAVYDPNDPGGTLGLVLVDSLANTWDYGGFDTNWGGSTGLFLLDPIRPYFTNPAVRPTPSSDRGGPPLAEIFVTSGTTVTVTDDGGLAAGYANGVSFSDIPGGYAVLPLVGGPTPPVGFRLPDAGRYRIAMTGAPRPEVTAFLDRGDTRLTFGRADATAGQTDLLAIDAEGLLHVRNPDAIPKAIGLSALFQAGTEERLLAMDELGLFGADSVRFRTENNSDARLENPGAATTYAVSLWRARPDGMLRFYAPGVTLGAGATHRLRPGWATLQDGTVEIDIDADGDGTFETTIEVANTVDSAPPPDQIPTAVTLWPPAPNPSAGGAVLRYLIPNAGAVRIAVFDMLGREVAVLVDGHRTAGPQEVVLEAGRFAPGSYLIRLQAGGAARTQRLTVTR